MSEFVTEFNERDDDERFVGSIIVRRPGSSVDQAFFRFNVTENVGLERPRFSEDLPEEAWEAAFEHFLEVRGEL